MRIYCFIRLKCLLIAAVLAMLACESHAETAPTPSNSIQAPQSTSMKELRHQAAQRRRRLLYNNDGGETTRGMTEPTVENLLKQRTNMLADTQVDTLLYCTKTTGLDLCTHFTKIGTLFTTRDGGYDHNQMAALFEKGIDPLRVIIDYCKQHNMEVFWSIRMNDTHDGASAIYGPINLRENRLKSSHPEYMLGTEKKPPKHGKWTALDFGRPEVREHAFRLIEEVCRNYDVDGIELDFFRHPVYFQSNARGEPATDADRAATTELVTRVRNMADEVGQSRGRPILIGMRMPDSVEYCRAIGLDLEHWMAADLLDIYVPGSYYQLNEWDYSVALGHKYGVKVYPSLDDVRARDPEALAMRTSMLSYRARTADAWHSGADGVYLFNYPDVFKSDVNLFNELGNPENLAALDKDYFSSVRGAMQASGGNLPFQPYQNLETLNPDNPRSVKPGATETAKLYLGEDVASKSTATLKLRLKLQGVEHADQIQVALNGHNLKIQSSEKNWFEAAPANSNLRPGRNTVAITLPATTKQPAKWSDVVLQVRHATGK